MNRLQTLIATVAILTLISCKHEHPDGPEFPHGNKKQIKHIGTTELSVAGREKTVVTAGNKVLFAGGYYWIYVDIPGGAYSYIQSKRVDIYDAATNTWSIDSLSIPRSQIGTAVVNNKVYFAGGLTYDEIPYGPYQYDRRINTKRIDIYDLTTKTWQIDSLSEPKQYAAGAVFNNQVFFVGGRNGYNRATNTVDVYNVPTNTWTHQQMNAAAGGKFARSGNELFIVPEEGDTVTVYNLATNSVRTIQLSVKRGYMTVAAAGDLVIFAGGSVNYSNNSNVVDIYNTRTSTLTTDTLSIPRRRMGAVAIENKILFAGGIANDGYYTNRIDIYDVQTHTWSRDSLTFPTYEPSGSVVGNKVLIAAGPDAKTTVDIYELK
jgi:hypothetical protein